MMGDGKKEENEDERLKELVPLWLCRAEIASNAHYFASNRYLRLHYYLTLSNIISAIFTLVLASSSFFETVLSQVGLYAIAFFSATVVATSAAQYILDFRHTSNRHKFSVNEYSNIKRKIERLIASDELSIDSVHRISSTLNWIAKSSLHVRRKLWLKSKKSYGESYLDIKKAEDIFLEVLNNN